MTRGTGNKMRAISVTIFVTAVAIYRPVAIDTIPCRDGSIPTSFKWVARKYQGEDNCNAISTDDG